MRRLRNLTITVEEEVARWARIKAAEGDTSVARLVGDLLRHHMDEEHAYERAMKDHFAQRPLRLRKAGGYPTRDQMHGR